MMNEFWECFFVYGVFVFNDVINIIFQVLNFIFFNNVGMKMVVLLRFFDYFLEIFFSFEYVQIMLRFDFDFVVNIGLSFDEFVCYYFCLCLMIFNFIFDLIVKVVYFVNDKVKGKGLGVCGWGVNFLVEDLEKNIYVVDKLLFVKVGMLFLFGFKEKGKDVSDDVDVEMVDVVGEFLEWVLEVMKCLEEVYYEVILYIWVFCLFLSVLFVSNINFKQVYVKNGGVEFLFNFFEFLVFLEGFDKMMVLCMFL